MNVILVAEDKDEIKSTRNKIQEVLVKTTLLKKVGVQSLFDKQDISCDKIVFMLNNVTPGKLDKVAEWRTNVLKINTESKWLLLCVSDSGMIAASRSWNLDILKSTNCIPVTNYIRLMEWWPKMLMFLCQFSTFSLNNVASVFQCGPDRGRYFIEELCAVLDRMFKSVDTEQIVSYTIGDYTIVLCDTLNRELPAAMKTDLRALKTSGHVVLFHSLDSAEASTDVQWAATYYYNCLRSLEFVAVVMGNLGLIQVDRRQLVTPTKPNQPRGQLKLSRSESGAVLSWNPISDNEDTDTIIVLRHQQYNGAWQPLVEVDSTVTTYNVDKSLLTENTKHRFSLTVQSNSGDSKQLISKWYMCKQYRLDGTKLVKKVLFILLFLPFVCLDAFVLIQNTVNFYTLIIICTMPLDESLAHLHVTNSVVLAVYTICWIVMGIHVVFAPLVAINFFYSVISPALADEFKYGIFSLPGYFLESIFTESVFTEV